MILWNMTDMMLNQCTYLLQTVEEHVNLICWREYITPYQKDCFIIERTLKKERVLLLEHTGILIENIGFIIHSGLAITPGTKLLGLNHKSRAALRNIPSEVIFLAIDVLFMISSDLWTDIDPRLGAIFMMIPQKNICFCWYNKLQIECNHNLRLKTDCHTLLFIW